MFSSNQILTISGALNSNELEIALEFALTYSGDYKNMTQEEIDRGCKLVYQITKDGKYCIGWGFETVPKGWSEYSFKFDIATVSSTIRQYLENFPINKKFLGSGLYEKGFIMKTIETCFNDEAYGIKSPFYCIVYFESFSCFYAKYKNPRVKPVDLLIGL